MTDLLDLKTLLVAPWSLRHMPILMRALSACPWRISEVAAPDFPTGQLWANLAQLPITADLAGIEAVLALWDGKDDRIGLTIQTARDAGLMVHVHEIDLHDNAHILLLGLRAAEFSVRVEDGKLLVAPIARLTPQQREAAKLYRAELIALIEEEERWEEKAELMADVVPPEFEGEPQHTVCLAERMLLRWHDEQGNEEAALAVDAGAYQAFVVWATQHGELRRAEKESPRRKHARRSRG